jgi:hypothetical protein
VRKISSCFRRQALHAAVLGFDHPAGGRRLRFEAPIPAERQSLAWKKSKKRRSGDGLGRW